MNTRVTQRKADMDEAELAPEAPAGRTSGDDAVSLIIADLAMLAGTALLRKGVERGILSGKPRDKAERELAETKPRSAGLAKKAGKLATKSAPIAGAVVAGLLIKNLFDRSQRVRARKYGAKPPSDDKPEGEA